MPWPFPDAPASEAPNHIQERMERARANALPPYPEYSSNPDAWSSPNGPDAPNPDTHPEAYKAWRGRYGY